MSQPPPRDLLESTHQFPGKFVFKAIGINEDDFAARVVAVVRVALAQDVDPPFELRYTSGGRHVSISLEPWIESSEQAMAIFDRIRALPGLVMLL